MRSVEGQRLAFRLVSPSPLYHFPAESAVDLPHNLRGLPDRRLEGVSASRRVGHAEMGRRLDRVAIKPL